MSKKGKVIILIILLSLIIFGLISFMVSVIVNGKNNFINFGFVTKTSTNLVHNKEYSNNFTDININSDAAEIKIINTNDSIVKVLVYSEKNVTNNVSENETSLEITSQQKNRFFSFNHKNSKIEIYLPSTYDKNINIENNYGDIHIYDFEKANIEVESDAGDVKVETVNYIEIKNAYGDTTIGKANNIDLESDCGDIVIDEVNNINAKNDLGDIDIKKVNEYLDVTADCGDINIDKISLTKNSNIVNNLGDIEIDSITGVYVDAKTNLGEVSINNNDHKSDIILKIENDCGDIEIKN